MAEGTYEFECMRAELLGVEKPDQEEFEKARAERLKAEQEEREAEEATILEKEEESLRNTGGKLDELNSILTATQSKINRLKQSARGSITTMFRGQSVDETSSSASSSRRGTTGDVGSGGDINEALGNLDEMKTQQQGRSSISLMRNASLDIQGKMTSHLDKLDSLINKAEHAEVAMSSQTKQMRKIAK